MCLLSKDTDVCLLGLSNHLSRRKNLSTQLKSNAYDVKRNNLSAFSNGLSAEKNRLPFWLMVAKMHEIKSRHKNIMSPKLFQTVLILVIKLHKLRYYPVSFKGVTSVSRIISQMSLYYEISHHSFRSCLLMRTSIFNLYLEIQGLAKPFANYVS